MSEAERSDVVNRQVSVTVVIFLFGAAQNTSDGNGSSKEERLNDIQKAAGSSPARFHRKNQVSTEEYRLITGEWRFKSSRFSPAQKISARDVL